MLALACVHENPCSPQYRPFSYAFSNSSETASRKEIENTTVEEAPGGSKRPGSAMNHEGSMDAAAAGTGLRGLQKACLAHPSVGCIATCKPRSMIDEIGARQIGQRASPATSRTEHFSQQLAWRHGPKRVLRASSMQTTHRRASSFAAAASSARFGVPSPSDRHCWPQTCDLKKLSTPCAPLSVPPFLWRLLPEREMLWMTGSVSTKPSVGFHTPWRSHTSERFWE
mmetsp:Transcript_14672/g.37244  ORF Transcript_14672/g.37244 Transcript_14672/m.37244 type:complete len:226 (+) Transcript_14672:283-960(+)